MEMKFEFDTDARCGHVALPVHINGEGPFLLHLDTGGARTSLSHSVVKKLGLEATDPPKEMEAVGVGGPVDIKLSKVDKIEIGTEVLEDEEIIVVDFEGIFGTQFDGIIGHSMLKHYKMTVDYVNQTFKLEKDNGNASNKSVEWAGFEYLDGTHLVGVPVHINENGPYMFAVDTGSSGNVMTPKVAQDLGLMVPAAGASDACSGGDCAGVGGTMTGYGVQVRRLTVGSAAQEDVIVGVIDLKVVSSKGDALDNGIIGYPFLKDYQLIIDYPNERFALVNGQNSN
ncbi:MAG: aspartyl protease family protein [Candidatus Thorarchaeota archaeon]|nr:MAG: aspartyl protease family protein [Candidatus Thorarchaeota archaeon]